MKNIFSNISVSKKTVILLFLFVLIPELIAGIVIFSRISAFNITSEKRVTMQKLKNTSDSLASYMETVEQIATDLSYERSVNEIARGEGAITRYTDANKEFGNVLKYNPYIVKLQILKGSEIVWQYGYRTGYILGDDGNEPYAQMVQDGLSYDIWSPGHIMHLLKKGDFSNENWFSSYYHGIYDERELQLLGVIALHIEEETLCSLFNNGVEDISSVCWLTNEDGQVISSTDKDFFKKGLPDELRFDRQNKKQGNINITYENEARSVFWYQCGETGNYLFQMRKLSGMKLNSMTYMLLVLLLFFSFCIGFLIFYNRYVLRPLRTLHQTIDNTNDLNLKQEIVPAYDDEIGDLTKAYGDMMLRIDQLIQDVYVETIKTQEAEKEALLSQINPHFLYNTLDSIRWNAMMNGDREVGKQLEALSVMLREMLNFGNKYTTLEKEMTIIQKYCYLLQARFRNDIDIKIEIEPGNEMWQIPKLLIQPLVENAYKHGLENKIGNKHIWIKVKRLHDKLVVYVADNGIGCKAKDIKEKIAGTGEECFALRNIKERIWMEYGNEGKFLFFSHQGKGTLVKLILQLRASNLFEV